MENDIIDGEIDTTTRHFDPMILLRTTPQKLLDSI